MDFNEIGLLVDRENLAIKLMTLLTPLYHIKLGNSSFVRSSKVNIIAVFKNFIKQEIPIVMALAVGDSFYYKQNIKGDSYAFLKLDIYGVC